MNSASLETQRVTSISQNSNTYLLLLFFQVDENDDRVLDLDEFVMFMSEFSKEAKVSIFELTYFMMTVMGEKVANPPKSMCPQRRASQKSLFERFMGTLQEEEIERPEAASGQRLKIW